MTERGLEQDQLGPPKHLCVDAKTVRDEPGTVPRPTDADQLARFLKTLRDQGGAAGNYALIENLGWNEDEYWRLREKLIDRGDIVRGRGRGGSVRIVEEEDEEESVADEVDADATARPSPPMREQDLYEPCLQTLRGQWAREQGLESLHLETTASQGSRNTGGIWTRPDIAGVSLRVFRHWPGRLFDLWTFEIKPVSAFNVIGIFEAAAHARYSTHSWALYHVTDDAETEDTTRMAAEAQRLGIGLVFFTEPDDFETWDIRAESRRQTPDPALHEEFVSVQLSEDAKDRISKWSKA